MGTAAACTPVSAAETPTGGGGVPASTVLRCEELRKISDGKPMFKTSRKWFVLYDDNLNPLSGGGGGVGEQQPSVVGGKHVPAHLEYHDSEKKWREGKTANRDI